MQEKTKKADAGAMMSQEFVWCANNHFYNSFQYDRRPFKIVFYLCIE